MPKSQYWDRIADLTGALTIHFQDYRSLSHFECPDLTHLDATDAQDFTKSLVGILKERGCFAGQANILSGNDPSDSSDSQFESAMRHNPLNEDSHRH